MHARQSPRRATKRRRPSREHPDRATCPRWVLLIMPRKSHMELIFQPAQRSQRRRAHPSYVDPPGKWEASRFAVGPAGESIVPKNVGVAFVHDHL